MAEKIKLFQRKTYQMILFLIGAVTTMVVGGTTTSHKLSAYELSEFDLVSLLGKHASADTVTSGSGDTIVDDGNGHDVAGTQNSNGFGGTPNDGPQGPSDGWGDSSGSDGGTGSDGGGNR